jgi:hypothetical protein
MYFNSNKIKYSFIIFYLVFQIPCVLLGFASNEREYTGLSIAAWVMVSTVSLFIVVPGVMMLKHKLSISLLLFISMDAGYLFIYTNATNNFHEILYDSFLGVEDGAVFFFTYLFSLFFALLLDNCRTAHSE